MWSQIVTDCMLRNHKKLRRLKFPTPALAKRFGFTSEYLRNSIMSNNYFLFQYYYFAKVPRCSVKLVVFLKIKN